MALLDKSYGSIPVVFPSQPYSSGSMFAAFVVSYRSSDVDQTLRVVNFRQQLRWWRLMTDIPVYVFLSGWSAQQVAADPEVQRLPHHHIKMLPAQSLILNRIACLTAFYASEHPFGIMMDDDAILYHSPLHNSGAALFSEMARNGVAAYADVDVFFPINPAKLPGQNGIWKANPAPYQSHHVFTANYDLKGSLFIVRNFPLFARQPVLPPESFIGHGEDTLFAVEAIRQGCTVYRCDNIVLKEMTGPSHFSHTAAAMKAGNQVIAQRYAPYGLTMQTAAKRAHLLDRAKMVEACLGGKPHQVTVEK